MAPEHLKFPHRVKLQLYAINCLSSTLQHPAFWADFVEKLMLDRRRKG
jgi:hypothetical protein